MASFVQNSVKIVTKLECQNFIGYKSIFYNDLCTQRFYFSRLLNPTQKKRRFQAKNAGKQIIKNLIFYAY